MTKITTKSAIYLTLLTTCFASENIESDLEMEITAVKTPDWIASSSISENEKQEEKISQGLPMTIHDLKTTQEINTQASQIWTDIIAITRKFIFDYGAQTASGLTVLGVWYRYCS